VLDFSSDECELNTTGACVVLPHCLQRCKTWIWFSHHFEASYLQAFNAD